MKDSLTLAFLALSDPDRDNLVAWHESLTKTFEREVESASLSHRADALRAATAEIGVQVALRALNEFIFILHRMCVPPTSVNKVLPWYIEELTLVAHDDWFPRAASRFGFEPILRSNETDLRMIVPRDFRIHLPAEVSKPIEANHVIDTKLWHKHNAIVVKHLATVAEASHVSRLSAICKMAAEVFDSFAGERIALVKSHDDMPDFEAEMKTYLARVVAPEMVHLNLTEEERGSVSISVQSRLRYWLGESYYRLEQPKAPHSSGASEPQQNDEIISAPQLNESATSIPVPGPATTPNPEHCFEAEEDREHFITNYTRLWRCSEAGLARTARVDPSDLTRWKNGSLPKESGKKMRIEEVLRKNQAPTPRAKR